MPNVLNEFAGDGVTRTFNFSMTGGYLSRDYVYFFTRPNGDLLNYTPYNDDDVTWITDFSVRTAKPIPVGTTFVILRSTTLDPLVDFQNTSRITEKNLDTATWQSIHIAAETSDTVGRIQVVATNAKEESAKALTLAQGAAGDAAASAASALAAQVSAGSAQEAALAAQSEAGAAAADAATAVSTAAQAGATASTAVATANAATTAAEAATSIAKAATATANAATATADAATATANAAATAAASAVGTANGASATASAASAAAASATSTANNAMTVANDAKALVDEAVAGAVISFNGRSGTVTSQAGDYTAAMVGLGNVNNTSDADKPLSTAMQSALNSKASVSEVASKAERAALQTVVNALYSAIIGVPQPLPTAAVPAGWVAMQGQPFNTAQNPILASKYPSGVLPDMRKRFIRGAGADRSVLTLEANANKSHSHTASTTTAGSHTHTVTVSSGGSHAHSVSGSTSVAGSHTHPVTTGFNDGPASGPLISNFRGNSATGTRYTGAGGEHSHTLSGTADAAGEHSHTAYVTSADGHTHSVTVAADGSTDARPDNIAFQWCCMTDAAIPTV